MENRLNRIEEKLDSVNEKIAEMQSLHAENTAILREHMRRSLALEQQNEILKETLEAYRKETEEQFKPINKFVDRAKFLGILLSTVFTAIIAIDKLGFFNRLF